MSSKKASAVIIYRGPLERARLSFIIETINTLAVQVSFVWIFPGVLNEKRRSFSEDYLKQYPFRDITILEHRWRQVFQTRKVINEKLKRDQPSFLALVGFSSLFFGIKMPKTKQLWFVNGIPEEKAFHSNTVITRLTGWMQWQLQVKGGIKPDLVVTVSDRMKKMVADKVADVPIFSAPTCVDTSTFGANTASERKYFTYLGSGAPWQALDLLSSVWQQIHAQDKNIKFRVISRDERCKVLSKGIAPGNIEFVQSNDFRKVAQFLHESIVGFLLRKDNIVNRVSFPTKLAEYLASGSWVVSSDLDWDISDYFHRYKIGILLSPAADAKTMASQVLAFYEKWKQQPALDLKKCADALDRERWNELLRAEILNVLDK